MRYNLRTLQSVVGKQCVAVVLKGNAYGHGYEEVSEALSMRRELTACVHSTHEVFDIMQHGYWHRIIVMGVISPQGLNLRHLPPATELTVGTFPLLERCLRSDMRRGLHLKFDTGMGRQGFNLSDLPLVFEKLAAHKDKNWVVGISSHFANVEDVLEQDYAERQLALFDEVYAAFKSRGYEVERHIASSAGALVLPSSRLDFCRIGISLYGFLAVKASAVVLFQAQQRDD